MRVVALLILASLPCSFAFGECSNYKNLDEADRSMSYSASFPNYKCDQYQLQFGWYRFSGAAGTMMPTSCVPKNKCGTAATGWLQTRHPSPSEGAIKGKVCFHWTDNSNGGLDNCCMWSGETRVRNCGSFYVYELTPPPVCNLRYCGNGAQSSTQPPNPGPIPPPNQGGGLVNAPECSNYQILDQADRSVNAPGGYTDDAAVRLQRGWYRFQGAAGTMMSTSCSPVNRCGTQATGWIQDPHPSQSEGTKQVKVCFHYQTCCDFPVSIQVRNCGSFYVYELVPTPGLLRYCGNGVQSPIPGPNSVSNAPECSSYKTLNEADRSVNALGGYTDDAAVRLQRGWYRFQGAAGTMMSTSCPPFNRCGTQATGWIQDPHPSQSEGTKQVKVCFHYQTCCDFPVSIQVRNCGPFYVYELVPTPGLLRYCGNGQ